VWTTSCRAFGGGGWMGVGGRFVGRQGMPGGGGRGDDEGARQTLVLRGPAEGLHNI